MSERFHEIVFIGGDMRQVYMANIFIESGFAVVVYGLDTKLLRGKYTVAQSLVDAIVSADVIIGPIPLTKNQVDICAMIPHADLTVKELTDFIAPKQRFFAGCITTEVVDYCKNNDVMCYDFMKDTELTVYNTIATAEGAILEAMLRQPTNLHRGNCLVLGYGKCARTIADKLKGMSAQVTVSARSSEARALADAAGFATLEMTELCDYISGYEYIFNTVPNLILTYKELEKVRKGAIIIDIASMPGGVDYIAAEKLGVAAYLCLGLPGKYAPKSSAEALVKVILS